MHATRGTHAPPLGGKRPRKKGHVPLKAKFRIGSIHGKINYKMCENGFHKSDIPEKSRLAKEEVKLSIKTDILGMQKPKWSSGTRIEAPVCVRKHNQLLIHDPTLNGYTYNFRAEVLPKKNPDIIQNSNKFQLDRSVLLKSRGKRLMNKGDVGPVVRAKEMPVNPALADMKPWNNASLITEKDRKIWVNHDERAHMRHSKRRNAALKEYVNPETKFRNTVAKQRKYKLAVLKGEINARKIHSAGGTEHGKRFTTTVSRKYKKYKHSGVWEFNKLFQKWMWSDTGSEVKDSHGDIVTVIDPDAYNFASPFS